MRISILALVDPLRIDQVVTNLVMNAIHYGCGKPIEVSVTPLDENRLRVRVEDHGTGITADDLPRLFGRFQRIASDAHQSGLGLGLYISRHIARAHGGDITVTSEVGKGSVFTLELPLGVSEAKTAAGAG